MNRVQLQRLLRGRIFDGLVVAAAAGAVAELAIADRPGASPTTPLWFQVLAVLALTLPLLARRRAPFGVPLAIVALAGAVSFVDGRLIPFAFATFLTVVAISFLFGMLPDRRQAVAGVLVTVAVGTAVNVNLPDATFEDYVFVPLIFVLTWLAGIALSSRLEEARAAEERAAQAERRRDEEARLAVAAERARIARELHDVVAHGVSVMTVQAGGVRRLLRDDQEREREALLAVEQTGRQALAELRQLLGIMRPEDEAAALAPQPGLRALDALARQVRDSGLTVEVEVAGDPYALPVGVDLSAYRVVEEALGRVLAHAAGTAHVVVRYEPDGLALEVEADGAVSPDGGSDARVLAALRERVAFHGGTLEARGGADGEGFAVHARIPVSAKDAAWLSAS